jgi:phenylacetate-coenzyme A ligase PaaK-like adenylate-forming protein
VTITPLHPWIAAAVGSPSLDRSALEHYQVLRLRQTLSVARSRSPFYRRLLADLPPQPQRLADLAGYPFTTPADVAERGLQLVCVPQDDIARVVTLDTSGTTGRPKRVWFTRADQQLTVDFFRVGMSTFTRPGDRVFVLLPCERPGSVGDLLAAALRAAGAWPVTHGVVVDLPRTLAAMHEHGVDVVVGIPSQVLALARADDSLRPSAVLLSTDHVPAAVTRAVEQAWGCTVFGHYGMTEMGLGGGVECRERLGYHLREADLLVEIVDPDTGHPLPDGQQGEVVFTTLTRAGMPLIRYRTGDLSRFLPDPCRCGTTLRTLERITRRIEGVVRLPGGATLCLADLDEALFALPGVLDFDVNVNVTDGPAQVRLDVAVRMNERADGRAGPVTAAEVEHALYCVPAIHRARAAGGFTVGLSLAAGTGAPAPAKRRIRLLARGSDRPVVTG